MLIRIEAPIVMMGAKLVHYNPQRGWTFCYGDITQVYDNDLLADFGNWVLRFLLSDVFYAIDTDLHEEHFAATCSGILEVDYRKSVSIETKKVDPIYEDCLQFRDRAARRNHRK